MNIAVFAADAFGLSIVEIFREKGHSIACLGLDEDTPEDMNRRIRETASCQTVFMAGDIRSGKALEALRTHHLDLVVLAWWPHIIKQPLLGAARKGFLNMHPSLLPYNRGKHYYFWSIVEDTPHGVTLHLIDEGIDSGGIAFQKRLDVGWTDTGRSLRDSGMSALIDLFRDNFDQIVSCEFDTTPVDTSQGTFHWGRELEQASRIDLDKTYTGRELLNMIRARSGFPRGGAWFEDKGSRYEVSIEITKVSDD